MSESENDPPKPPPREADQLAKNWIAQGIGGGMVQEGQVQPPPPPPPKKRSEKRKKKS